ncbi:MAG: 4-hydroxy-tetrahydrodipicolinate synthase [Bdellovibrionales bacterium]|nr:4-hydroxy-tetrahydrodipicolinate synthase [Bdellovibrionales bacterium]
MVKTNGSDKISGVVTALVTPFNKGRIDYASVKKLIQHQLDNGIQGFVVNGTTGESPTLDWDEIEKLFKYVKSEVDNEVPVILGTGSNSTKSTVRATQLAAKLKADAALVVCPYYNKPTQEGLVQHYQTVARSSKCPIILYNVPGRTVISINPETTIKLAKEKNIMGIKEASGHIENAEYLHRRAPKNFLLMSGDDSTCVDFILAGGAGVISVISHIIPAQLRKLSDAARAGDISARSEYFKFKELIEALSMEPNPTPVKMMLYMMGIIKSPELRLPMLEASRGSCMKIKNTLKKFELM